MSALAATVDPATDDLRVEAAVTRARRRVGAAGVLAMVAMPAAFAVLGRPSYMTAAVFAVIVGLAAISLVVLLGYVGQVSLAQFAFMGIGALAVARLSPYIGYWAALPVAGLLAVPAGLVAAVPALRLRGIYLAVATLGFSQVVVETVLMNTSLLGGSGQVIHVDRPRLLGFDFPATLGGRAALYFIDLFIVAVFVLFTVNLRSRKTGLAFAAVRDSEVAAASIGIDVVKYKLVAFAVSSFYAAVAGGLYMALSPDVDPRFLFDALHGSIPLLIVLVIGGVASISGALLASYLFAMMPLLLPPLANGLLHDLHVGADFNPDLVIAIFGILLLRGLTTMPRGLVGELDRLLRRRVLRREVELAGSRVREVAV